MTKYLALALIAFSMVTGVCMAETLSKVVELTADEKAEIRKAENDVKRAEIILSEIKNKIAKSHGLFAKTYMEWSTRLEFNNDYILQYYENHMDNKMIEIGVDTIMLDSSNPFTPKLTPR